VRSPCKRDTSCHTYCGKYFFKFSTRVSYRIYKITGNILLIKGSCPLYDAVYFIVICLNHMPTLVFWVVILCVLVRYIDNSNTASIFRSEDGDSRFFWIVGTYLQVHTASQPRKPKLIRFYPWEHTISYTVYIFYLLLTVREGITNEIVVSKYWMSVMLKPAHNIWVHYQVC
jgi:hypothetical protein